MENNKDILKNISYGKIEKIPNIVNGKPIGELSGHDTARALYHVTNLFLGSNKRFTDFLNNLGNLYLKSDDSGKKILFELIENDQNSLDEILKHCQAAQKTE